jgi:predicted secreted acid phosphatase
MSRPLQRLLAATALIALLAAGGARAADCPAMPDMHIPPPPPPPLNIDIVKQALRDYQKGDYAADLAAVYAAARGYVEARADAVSQPAVVLDIDETSLSNWPNIDADDFGFILGGPCTLEKGLPCGFNAWVGRGDAAAIEPALDFFNAAKAKKVAVVFITARKESQRMITELNLRHAGYDGWAKLVLKPDGDTSSAQAYKSAAREQLMKDDHYTIIANIGDQLSDLAGGSAECSFKLPNPFYFIK